MSAADDIEFNPPEVGLLPGETIVWNQKANSPFITLWCGGCLTLSSFFLIPFAYVVLGSTYGNSLAFLVLIGIIYSIYVYIRTRRTMYFLTSKRVLEVRGGFIAKQLSRELFSGRPQSEYLQIKEESYTESGTRFIRIRVFDIPSNVLIEMKGMDKDVAKVFENLGT